MGAACCAGSAIAGSAAPTSLLDGTVYSFLTAVPIGIYHYYPQLALLLVTLAVVAASTFYVVLVMLTPEQKKSSASELTYLSARTKEGQPLASLESAEAEVQLSVVIPAYNEKERLPIMLKETIEYLEELKAHGRSLTQGLDKHTEGSATLASGWTQRQASSAVHQALHEPLSSYEIIIVDDGSKDSTHQVALDYAASLASRPDLRVVRLVKNRGKGGAVRHGVLHSRGSLILFADADGATRFGELSKLCQTLSSVVTDKGHGVAVGSRAHMVKSDAVVKRSFVRNFLMHCFHLLLTLLLRPPTLRGILRRMSGLGSAGKSECSNGASKVVSLPVQPEIKDTQCGFKLFTRRTAQLVFPSAHIDGWIFDVELLILTQMSSELAQAQLANRTARPPNLGAHVKDEPEWQQLRGLPIPIAEVAVHWQEVGGSKIDLVRDSIRMALDLVVIRANYGLGRWSSPPPAI